MVEDSQCVITKAKVRTSCIFSPRPTDSHPIRPRAGRQEATRRHVVISIRTFFMCYPAPMPPSRTLVLSFDLSSYPSVPSSYPLLLSSFERTNGVRSFLVYPANPPQLPSPPLKIHLPSTSHPPQDGPGLGKKGRNKAATFAR